MKRIFIVAATFLLAFATSALFDVQFIARHWARTALVVMLILLELAMGFWAIKTESETKNQE